jgi:hypothetical protein
MPSTLATQAARSEAVLSLLAKLESRLREHREAALRASDDARRLGQHGNRAYWSGVGEGHRHAAESVAVTYQAVRALYRVG